VLYSNRFSVEEKDLKLRIWQVLCSDFFSKYIPATASVLEIACGYGEFLLNIQAQRKVGVDLNPESQKYLTSDIEFLNQSATDMKSVKDASMDVVFASNFFEHLPSKNEMDKVLKEARRVLRTGGRLIIMQPNIRYCYNQYWDFYDHHLPLSDLSTKEGLEINGFKIERVIPRFMPYSTKSKLPKGPIFVRLYLKLPFLWKIFGKQFLIIATK
jgi:ubiquinone/menaquinone biosynthesis C-methylase UbiE